MNKTIFYLLLLIISSACSLKNTQNFISEGEYDAAIEIATQKLKKNKSNKKSKEYIALLEEAFTKAKDRDNRDISFLVKDANPQKLEKSKCSSRKNPTAFAFKNKWKRNHFCI